jgi:hypothetical protein
MYFLLQYAYVIFYFHLKAEGYEVKATDQSSSFPLIRSIMKKNMNSQVVYLVTEGPLGPTGHQRLTGRHMTFGLVCDVP